MNSVRNYSTMSTITDKSILERITNNDITAWDDLYEKYSPTMLGAISIFARNSILAEKILMDIWLELRDRNAISVTEEKLSMYLYVYSFKYTLFKLRSQGINPCVEGLETYPQIIQELCKKYAVEEKSDAKVYTSNDLKIRRNTFCWLPVLGINPFNKFVRSRLAI